MCQKAKVDSIILEQIKEGGLGTDLATEAAANNGNIILDNLVQYLFVQQNGMKIIEILTNIFENVELLE